MCKYCMEDSEPIIDTNYELGGAKTDGPDKKAKFGTMLMVEPSTKTLIVDTATNGMTFVLEKAEIKYCPMCGREL